MSERSCDAASCRLLKLGGFHSQPMGPASLSGILPADDSSSSGEKRTNRGILTPISSKGLGVWRQIGATVASTIGERSAATYCLNLW